MRFAIVSEARQDPGRSRLAGGTFSHVNICVFFLYSKYISGGISTQQVSLVQGMGDPWYFIQFCQC